MLFTTASPNRSNLGQDNPNSLFNPLCVADVQNLDIVSRFSCGHRPPLRRPLRLSLNRRERTGRDFVLINRETDYLGFLGLAELNTQDSKGIAEILRNSY